MTCAPRSAISTAMRPCCPRRPVSRSTTKRDRYLQTISDSAKQMGQLIDDLLVFSRMGRQDMLRTTVNFDQLVKTVLHDLRLDLQGRTISWTIGPIT